MRSDLKAFWRRFQDGVEVAVGSNAPDKLLGVRDGFLRYFYEGLDQPVPVAVVPQTLTEDRGGLCLSDEETVGLARSRARELHDALQDAYDFYAASEGGLHSVEIDDSIHWFVRNWTVIIGPTGEAWGASGSVEIPSRLISGMDDRQIPFAVPGTRRSGGMIASLTGGLESRRRAVSTATFHALAAALYGVLESRPVRRRNV